MKIFSAVSILLGALIQTGFSETAFDSKPAERVTVLVETRDAKPVSHVTVVCINSSTNAILIGKTIKGGIKRFETDAQGRFTFNLLRENLFFMLATDTGFALAQSRDLTNNPSITVEPWGHIEGIRMNLDQPMASEKLRINFDWLCLSDDVSTRERIGVSDETVTDLQGKFVFENVPPAGLLLTELRRHPKIWNLLEHMAVEPGEFKTVRILTQGLTVTGKLENMQITGKTDLNYRGNLNPVTAHHGMIPVIPREFDTPTKRTKWRQNWYKSEAGKQVNMPVDKQGGAGFEFQSDGSFITEMIAPGKYWVYAKVQQNGKILAAAHELSVVIPEPKTNSVNESFDVGTIPLSLPIIVGSVVADFTTKTLGGKFINLSDFRGKYVLLDFWATWCMPCVAEIPNLKATYDAFGGNNRFAMIGLSLDESVDAPKKFVRTRDMHWTQAFLGDWEQDNVTRNFEVNAIPSIWLIGPDGKIISRDLPGSKIKEAVAAALSTK